MSKYRIMKQGERYFIQENVPGLFWGSSWQDLSLDDGVYTTTYYDNLDEPKRLIDTWLRNSESYINLKKFKVEVVYER